MTRKLDHPKDEATASPINPLVENGLSRSSAR